MATLAGKPQTLQIVGNSSYGGGGYLLLRWCAFLLTHGWKVDVLATDPFVTNELAGIPGIGVIDDIQIPREIVPAADLRAFVKLVSLLRKQNYDVVHTYTATPGFLGRIAARLVSIPVILHHQAGWTVTEFSTWPERLLYTPLEYLATLASTSSICVSHAVAQQARKLGIAPKHKLVTICNGIDPQPFIRATQDSADQALRQELGLPPNSLLIGSTGRLAPQKDNDTLIRAMACLKDELHDKPFTLLLAGDGPDRAKLQSLVNSLSLSGQVHFLGFRRDIAALVAGLDIFATSSLWEGLSISLLEAMAAAKPIVATSIPPNAELIEHEVTGLLATPRDPPAIAHAIARFVHEPALAQRCAAAARERVLRHYTIERMFEETYRLYLDLLSLSRPKKVAR